MFVVAYSILHQGLGVDHPDTQTVRNNLMMFLFEKMLRSKELTCSDAEKMTKEERDELLAEALSQGTGEA